MSIVNNRECFFNIKSMRMISEESCDNEDWSNDAENSALPSQELITFLICIKMQNSYFK